MADQVQTFEFTSHASSDLTIVEPSPAYSDTSMNKKDKKDDKDAKEEHSVSLLSRERCWNESLTSQNAAANDHHNLQGDRT